MHMFKMTYSFNIMAIKMLMAFFLRNRKIVLKFIGIINNTK